LLLQKIVLIFNLLAWAFDNISAIVELSGYKSTTFPVTFFTSSAGLTGTRKYYLSAELTAGRHLGYLKKCPL